MTTPAGQSSSLAALIAALRETAEALEAGATWAQIGAAQHPPVTGRKAKRHANVV